jgi:hypothetical protein
MNNNDALPPSSPALSWSNACWQRGIKIQTLVGSVEESSKRASFIVVVAAVVAVAIVAVASVYASNPASPCGMCVVDTAFNGTFCS